MLTLFKEKLRRDAGWKNRLMTAALCLIVLIQVIWISFCFTNKKEGFHSDEPWSYGFANSYYAPYIYANGNFDPKEPVTLRNFGEWLSGDVFREYLTVGEGEAFRFDSVYYNTAYDQSPPFYCMLIHLISSFFPGRFSFCYAFFINILAFIGMQFLMYTVFVQMTGKRFCALLTCILYGFSAAGLNTSVFLRMYALLGFFCLLYVYSLLNMCRKNFSGILREYILMAASLILGGFTHYSFFIFAFFMTALLEAYIIFSQKEKKWKKAFAYAGMTLVSVGLNFLIYPYAIQSILSERDLQDTQVMKLPYWYNLECLLGYFSMDTLGVDWYYDRFDLMDTLAALAGLLVMAGLVCFACRKETWFQPVNRKVLLPLRDFLKDRNRILAWIQRNTNWFAVILFFAMFITIMISGKICKIFEMGRFADRYVFFLMPLWDILVVYGCIAFWKRICRKREWLAVGAASVLIMTSLLVQKQEESVYLFQGDNLKQLTEITAGQACVFMTNKAWALEWYSAALYDVGQFYAINVTDYQKQIEALDHPPETQNGTKIYLILEQACFEEDGISDAEDQIASGKLNLKTAGTDISEATFLALLKNTCGWIEDADYLYTQKGFRGYLDVYEIIRKEP